MPRCPWECCKNKKALTCMEGTLGASTRVKYCVYLTLQQSLRIGVLDPKLQFENRGTWSAKCFPTFPVRDALGQMSEHQPEGNCPLPRGAGLQLPPVPRSLPPGRKAKRDVALGYNRRPEFHSQHFKLVTFFFEPVSSPRK